jgi:hypothetical protein
MTRRFGRFRWATARFLCAIATGATFSLGPCADAQEQVWTVTQNAPVNFSLEFDWANGNVGGWTLNLLGEYESQDMGQHASEHSALQSAIENIFDLPQGSHAQRSSIVPPMPSEDDANNSLNTLNIANLLTSFQKAAKSSSLQTLESTYLIFPGQSDHPDARQSIDDLIHDAKETGPSTSNIDRVSFKVIRVDATAVCEVDSTQSDIALPSKTSVLFDAVTEDVDNSTDRFDDGVDTLAAKSNITVRSDVHPYVTTVTGLVNTESIDSVVASYASPRKRRFLFEDELPDSELRQLVPRWGEIFTSFESLDRYDFSIQPLSSHVSSPPIHASELSLVRVAIHSDAMVPSIDGIGHKDWIFRGEWIPNDIVTNTMSQDIRSMTSREQDFFGIFNDAIDTELQRWVRGDNVATNQGPPDYLLSIRAREVPKVIPHSSPIHDSESEIANRILFYDCSRIGGFVAVFGETSTKNEPGVPTFAGDLTYSGAVSLVDWKLILQSAPNLSDDFGPRRRTLTQPKSILRLAASQQQDSKQSDWASALAGNSYWIIFTDSSSAGRSYNGRTTTNWSDVSVRKPTLISTELLPAKEIRILNASEISNLYSKTQQ